ncbi:autotransporter domain-containing protein [Aureimonas fodinaquatilis]|uniref:Autotransporter domain-containing protein n=1 Tax=Aureimonas fodinaquatilis TaxID=2565783 RepID=A0A5B0E1B6_9HYPH|nr:autotransporter domain-containing protein [Aureimonas fodinaquatilis]KAA0972623.1 autotransporter domain-containing protein [Aureimonas fodinaquatilis]
MTRLCKFACTSNYGQVTRRLLATAAFAPLLALGVLGGTPALAEPSGNCTVTGNASVISCHVEEIAFSAVDGVVTATIDSEPTGAIVFNTSDSSTDPLDATLTIIGSTTVHRADYPAVVMFTERSNVQMKLIAGADVSLTSDKDFGAIWMRNNSSGSMYADNAGTVIANGTEQVGITLTTHGGDVTLINSGNVTSTQYRGLYADGSGEDELVVSITNTGTVTAEQAGIRAINYNGLATIDNSGQVVSNIRQGLVAWSSAGPSSVINSGTVTAKDDSAAVSWSETGNVTITNSGTLVSQDDTDHADAGIGHYGIHARVGVSGDVLVENKLGGSVSGEQMGIWAETKLGTSTVQQDGIVSGASGVVVTSDDGAVSLTNTGTINATGPGVTISGTSNMVENTGTIVSSSDVDATIVTGDFDTTIRNSGRIANTGGGDAIRFGSGVNRLYVNAENLNIEGIVKGGIGEDYLILDTGEAATVSMLSVGAKGQFRNFDYIEKTGNGVLTFADSSGGFTGSTLVKSGELVVNGDNALSAVTVFAGATLSGSGKVGATALQAGATIAPGNSPGTLEIVGDYNQASGTVYEAELVPGSMVSDLIAVSGAATIDAGAVLNLSRYGSGEFATNAHYTVLTATDGVAGTYELTGERAISAFFELDAVYAPNAIYINAVQTRPFTAAAVTPNQFAAATGVQSLSYDNALRLAVGAFQSDAPMPAALDQLSGEVYASAKTGLLQDSRFVREATTRQLQSSFEGGERAIWMQGYGSWGSFDGNTNVAGANRDAGGLFLGVDGSVQDALRIGVVGGYGHSKLELDGGRGSVSADTYSLGVYGGGQWDAFNLKLGLNHAWHDMSSSRAVAFSGFADALSADYSARTAQAYGEVGYGVDVKSVSFEPFAGIAYVNLDTSSFTEAGGAESLSSNGDTQEASFTTLGLRASSDFKVNGITVSANGMAGWRHSLNDDVPASTNSFAGSGLFAVSGVPLAQDVAVLEAGFSAEFRPNASFAVNYSGQFGSGISDHGIRAGLRVKF